MGRSAPPVYDFELSFYQALGIRWETGRRYRKLGVLKADAKTSSGRPLFLANAQTIEKAYSFRSSREKRYSDDVIWMNVTAFRRQKRRRVSA